MWHREAVRHVGQQRAQREDELHAERLRQIGDDRGEGAPAHRGLRAAEEHQIAGRARNPRDEDLDRGPDDLAGLPGDEPHLGTHALEVVELLGIDLGEARRPERAAQEGQRRGGGVARVVPAGESADQGRGSQPVGPVLPNQWLHPLHRTSCRGVTSRSRGNTALRHPRHAPSRRRGGGGFCLHAQGAPADARRGALSRARAA